MKMQALYAQIAFSRFSGNHYHRTQLSLLDVWRRRAWRHDGARPGFVKMAGTNAQGAMRVMPSRQRQILCIGIHHGSERYRVRCRVMRFKILGAEIEKRDWRTASSQVSLG
jgi:hypothetical protein